MPRVGINGGACAYDTIGAAIAAAASGDTIYVSPGEYIEQPGLVDVPLDFVAGTSECAPPGALVPVSPPVTITTFGALGGLFEIDSAGSSPIDVSFSGFQFSNAIGDEGGLLEIRNANVQVRRSVLTLGTAEFGGCIAVDGGSLRILRSELTDCDATVDGGAINVQDGSATIEDTEVRSSTARRGGAVYLATSAESTSALRILRSTFVENEARSFGGAVAVESSPSGTETVDISDSEFINNEAGFFGGAIRVLRADSLYVTTSEFSANAVVTSTNELAGGGAVHDVGSGSARFSDTVFIGNSSTAQGGGLWSAESTVEISGGRFEDNEARSGGAIYGSSNGELTTVNTILRGNDALNGNGGGIFWQEGDLILENATLEQNTAFSQGGGAFVSRTSGRIDNSKFFSNVANTGGGIAVLNGRSLVVRSVSTGSKACLGSDLSANAYCSEFRDNEAGLGGAVAALRTDASSSQATLLLDGVALIGNDASNAGRHVFAAAGASDAATEDNVIELRNVLVTRGQFVSAGINYPEAIFVGEKIDLRLNSITVAGLPGPAILAEGPDARLTLLNTLLWDNADPSFASLNGTSVTTECAYSEPEQMDSRNLGANVDPMFVVDPDRGNYRLDPLASPLLNACGTGPVDDLDGVGRTQGREPGAFEVGNQTVQLLVVNPAAGLVTGEDGVEDTVSVALAKAPLEPVYVAITSSQQDEAVASVDSLVFVPVNWDQPQFIAVAGVDDSENDGDQTFEILIGPTSSDDPAFGELETVVVPGVNVDDEADGDLVFADGFES